MKRILNLFLGVFFFCNYVIEAQKILEINGQPNWVKSLDIADYCSFYEETSNKPLTFQEAKTQKFVLFVGDLRKQRFSNRPLIIQWLRFTIKNTSTSDTIRLGLNTVHVFTSLYSGNTLIQKSGAYQKSKKTSNMNLMDLPINVAPLTSTTYWLRTEDRQSHLIPPQMLLSTQFNAISEGFKHGQEARYLFLILAMITGCFFFISIYASYHYYLYRNSSFFWYILYTIGAFFSGLHWMDIRLGMFIFPAVVNDIIFSIFLYLIPILYSFFIGNMLEFPIYFKKGWRLVKILTIICFFQMILEFTEVRWAWFPFPDYYGILLSPISIIILNIALAILAAKSKNPVKWFLFMGPISIMIFWCLPLLNLYAPSPEINAELFMIINFPIVSLLFGLLIEGICFTFALSYQSKLVFLEKNKIQEIQAQQLALALENKTNELNYQNEIVEAQKIKQIETHFEKRIAQTEMTALRAQMNPHFIFNCLNSIKLYTLENDSQTASEYLTKFSQLIRLVLENSRSEKISLQKELETIVLYIELEAMRFKEKVKYKINLNPEIDLQYIEIPPLLIQPYVENAIWHGLMHKEEGGNITINILQPSEYLIIIEIEDDGIGREKALEYKSKTATKQKSFGMKMTSERLEAINYIYQNKTNVKILDLKDESGNAIGTKVIIEIQL
ncbi:MAG: histidine kinase [Bacteroidota bacterium]